MGDWRSWVRDVTYPDDMSTAARKAGFDKSTMTRWMQGNNADPSRIVRLARAYGADPVKGLVALGLLTREEASGRSGFTMREAVRSAPSPVLANELVRRADERKD